MKIESLNASAHVDNIASNRILQKIGLKFTENYIEDAISWNWYELKNNKIV